MKKIVIDVHHHVHRPPVKWWQPRTIIVVGGGTIAFILNNTPLGELLLTVIRNALQ